MKHIQFDYSTNLGGISKIYAIPVSSFKTLRYDYIKKLTYLDIVNREDLIEIYTTEDSGEFNEDQENGCYSIQISGVTPKSNPLNREQLMRLDTEYWYVLFQDNNDYIRLAGTDENQLVFTRTDNAGKLNTRNQTSFMFKGSQTNPCYFIEIDLLNI